MYLNFLFSPVDFSTSHTRYSTLYSFDTVLKMQFSARVSCLVRISHSECPEKTLEVRLRSTETQSTYNIFLVEVRGVIDVHYASLTSQGVQHSVFYRDGHPSRYQHRPTGLNFGEQTGTAVSLR